MSIRQFHFAWLDAEGTPFDPVAHARQDLPIKSVKVREEENLLAHTVTIVTRSMVVDGLRGRLWGILSYRTPDGVLHPLARGKRRPAPAVQRSGELSVEFTVLPSAWEDIQDTALAPLKVAPYWTDLLVPFERRSDPKEILDGRRRIGHFDRVTHAYTLPELLGLGLPVKRLTARELVGWKDGGGVKVRRTTQPLAGVDSEVVFEWTQSDNGFVELTAALREAFPGGNVGDRTASLGPGSDKKIPAGVIATCTGESFENSFPSQGSGVGGASGYTILQSALRKVKAPEGAAAKSGKVNGQKAKYDYTSDADLVKPLGMMLDIDFYEAELALGYELRQKRHERFTWFTPSAGVAYEDGKVEKISAKGQDPTIDRDTLPYLPNENVDAGERRRVGQNVWQAKRTHLTRGPFTQDLYDAAGAEQWTLQVGNAAPAGTINASTFLTTDAGQVVLAVVTNKAIKRIALSKRGNEVSFIVPLDLWPDVSTTWLVDLDLGSFGEDYFEGGRCQGKVISVDIEKASTQDYAKVNVTIACCDGTGAASPSPAEGINPSGEIWDGVSLSPSRNLPYPATPVPAAVVYAENAAWDQVAAVQAGDFTGVAPRNDRTANDPKHILTNVKTKVTLAATPISGQPALTLDVSLTATAWQGPKQISFATV